ncbi:MAG: PQQ-dependent sugar dehydrogenase [Acidobacteriota bacterium]
MANRVRWSWAQTSVCLALALTSSVWAQVLPSGLKVEKILTNTAELGSLAQSPTGELWLLERSTGIMRVLVTGTERATLTLGVTSTGQSGLLDIAFAPDYATSGIAFVSYVDTGSHLRVGRVLRSSTGVTFDGNVLDVGTVTDFTRPGGGLALTRDGKLVMATGDFGTSTNAQNASSLAGKVLRMNLDGSAPLDNPTPGSLVFAKGFRNGRSVGYNGASSRADGTVYNSDLGNASGQTAADELNVVRPNGNYAWDACSGASCAGYDAPIQSWPSASLVNPKAIAVLRSDDLGAARRNSVIFACPRNDGAQKGSVEEQPMSGAELDVAGTMRSFFNPANDADGTADAGCPTRVNAITAARDGWAYAANIGSNTGIWRIYKDDPGPREVSKTGSPFGLSVEKAGAQVKLGWENLGSLDAGRNKRFAAGQRAEAYELFEGSLPITGTYDHAAVLSTNGTAEGLARLTANVTPAAGSRYFLVNAQGNNYEGSLGKASNGTSRPLPSGTTANYCDTIGYDSVTNKCAPEFKHQGTGQPITLVDYNPRSATYLQPINLAALRGKIVKLALTSKNCFWCTVEAQDEARASRDFGARDFVNVSVYTLTYGYWDAVPTANCATEVATWANTYLTNAIIVCDPDNDGDGKGDISKKQYDHCSCAPQNYYIDKGGVIYNYVAGANFYADVAAKVVPEINPESCE